MVMDLFELLRRLSTLHGLNDGPDVLQAFLLLPFFFCDPVFCLENGDFISYSVDIGRIVEQAHVDVGRETEWLQTLANGIGE